MSKYYATGTKQVKVKELDDNGKMVNVSKTVSVVISFDEMQNVDQRVKAVNAAEALARKDKKLTIDGVYVVKGINRGGSTMTKYAKQRKLQATLKHKANRNKKLKK